MPPRRKDKASGRLKWTNQMVIDILECRKRAVEQRGRNNDNATGRRRTGYMEIMKQLWEEKGYISMGLTAQNLRDKAAYYEKSWRDVGASSSGNENRNLQESIVTQENGEAENADVAMIEDNADQICINENANSGIFLASIETEQSNQPVIHYTESDEVPGEPNNNESVLLHADVATIEDNADQICINENANSGILLALIETEQSNQPVIHYTESDEVPEEPNNNESVLLHDESDFQWGEVNGNAFCQRVDRAYEAIVHWKRNIFLIPSGKVGKSFIRELARLYQSYADGSALERVALKASFVMQCLLLQKPHAKSKTKEHSNHLERRLKLWSEGNIGALLNEGKCIQKHLKSNTQRTVEFEKIARGFSRLMLQGKTNQAVRLISNAEKGGLLSIDDLIPTRTDENGNTIWQTTRDVLTEKHPEGMIPPPETLLTELEEDTICHDPIIFERITGDSIRQAANRTQGAAGPSGVDAYLWRRFCSSFKSASVDLCNAMAGVARRLCTTPVNPDGISAFVACRLIPLDKDPGVRPIGIGEVPRRIIAKSILKVVGEDVKSAAGALQTCAGHEAGCEAAVHAMKEIGTSEETEAFLLVDATNAFNTINRQAALHNIQIICPAMSTMLHNTYTKPIRLFVTGGGEISSMEGTTQGDPLAMAMYALAITPLIKRLRREDPDVKQVWFADDSTAAGSLKALKSWWQHLTDGGPGFGYFPNASKTTLIVKPEFVEKANEMFEGSGIEITSEGQKILGAAIGTSNFVEEYVVKKVEKWVNEILALSKIAEMYPHAAYAAFTHAIMGKWQYIMRTIGNIDSLFQPIEDAINEKLIPALTGRDKCSSQERKLLSLPTRLGGLNIINPVAAANTQFDASQKIAAPLKEMIINQTESYRKPELQDIKSNLRQQKNQHHARVAAEVRESLPQNKQRSMDLVNEKGSSSWLTTLPLKDQGFSLNKGEFRDAVSLRYGWQLKNLAHHCVCGASFSTDHAMICPHGGMTIVRHNEIRDLTADWLKEVCTETEKEPQLQPLSGENILPRTANRREEARADIKAKGFWCRQQSAFFDVRVFHPNAPSYRNTSIAALYRRQEQAKKREYGDRIREVEHASFTPLVFSTTGGISKETTVAYKRLAELLAFKHKTEYNTTLAWMRCSLSFALLRSAISCIRGTRASSAHRSSDTNIELTIAESRLS